MERNASVVGSGAFIGGPGSALSVLSVVEVEARTAFNQWGPNASLTIDGTLVALGSAPLRCAPGSRWTLQPGSSLVVDGGLLSVEGRLVLRSGAAVSQGGPPTSITAAWLSSLAPAPPAAGLWVRPSGVVEVASSALGSPTSLIAMDVLCQGAMVVTGAGVVLVHDAYTVVMDNASLALARWVHGCYWWYCHATRWFMRG
jgi:hypothetical protein